VISACSVNSVVQTNETRPKVKYPFVNTSLPGRLSDGFVQAAFIQVMPSNLTGARVNGEMVGGKNDLPAPCHFEAIGREIPEATHRHEGFLPSVEMTWLSSYDVGVFVLEGLEEVNLDIALRQAFLVNLTYIVVTEKFMTKWYGGRLNQQPFTWFTLVEPVAEIHKEVQRSYEELVAAPQKASEWGETGSPFYGQVIKRENIQVGFDFGLEGFSIFLWPRFDQIDYADEGYNFGGGQFMATVEDVGGPPIYTELKKVIDYLISPIRANVGEVDYGEIEVYCRGGRGYVVVAADTLPRTPLPALMKRMGLITPDNFLAGQGYFEPPPEELERWSNASSLEYLPEESRPQPQPDQESEVVCILCGRPEKPRVGLYD
jgi:hypothetical protein